MGEAGERLSEDLRVLHRLADRLAQEHGDLPRERSDRLLEAVASLIAEYEQKLGGRSAT